MVPDQCIHHLGDVWVDVFILFLIFILFIFAFLVVGVLRPVDVFGDCALLGE